MEFNITYAFQVKYILIDARGCHINIDSNEGDKFCVYWP